MADLTRQALAVNQAFLALGNEVFEADGARFVRNRAIPAVWDCNHVAHVRAAKPEQIDRLLARADKEFNHISYRRFDVDAYTPPEFEARLSHEGYRGGDALVMVLEGGPAGEPKPCEIRPIENEADWQAYEALHEIDWRDYVDRLGRRDDVWVAESMYRARRAKSPPVRYWLAWADGRAAAYLASWEGITGVGQVEDLFTHPDHRHRGLATALLHHGVADCRAHGAGPIVIVADPADTPKQIYTALGFRPVAIKRSYRKSLEPKGRT